MADTEENIVVEDQVKEEDQTENNAESGAQDTEEPVSSEEDTTVPAEDTTERVSEDTTSTVEGGTEEVVVTDDVDKKEDLSTENTEQEPPVIEEQKAVMVNSVEYDTLQEAINAASANDTIVLVQDVEITEKIVIDKNITIVSQTEEARTIRRGSNFKGVMFEVKNGAQLRFGNEAGTNPVIVDGGAKWVVDTLGLEDGMLVDDSINSETEIQEEEMMDQEEATEDIVNDPVDTEEAPVDAEEAPVDAEEAPVDTEETPVDTEETITDVEETTEQGENEIQLGNKLFSLPFAQKIVTLDVSSPTVEEAYNAGIKAEASMIQITNGKVYVYKNTVVQNNDNTNMSSGGGAISNNAGGSGTVFVYGTVQNNRASGTNANGGAIRNNGFVNVYDGAVISGNKASKNGGAIENYGGGVVTFQGGVVKSNEAEVGGAVWTDGKLDIQGGTYEHNKASKNGGSIFVNSQNNARKVEFKNGVFTGNDAAQGADVYLATEHATFQGNIQLEDVFVQNGKPLKVANTVNGKIGVTYENPELNTTIAIGNGYTLKEMDAQNVISNHEMYQTALQEGNVVLVYAAVVIDEQPKNTKADIEDGTTLSITAHAKSHKPVSYQWYESDSITGENGVAIGGATASTYKVEKNKVGVYYYYCVVSAEQATETTSDVVTVKMTDKNSAEVPTIITQPVGGAYDLQKEVTMTVDAMVEDGGELTYQWYRATKSDLTDGTLITGATEKTYTMKTEEVGTFYYYCVVTNTKKGLQHEVATAQSDAAVVTINGVAVVFNGVPYSNIQDALPYLEKGEGTLEVYRDITLNKTITVEQGNLVIKGENGKAPVITLDKSLTKQAFIVNGGTLTLENVVLDGGAVWTGTFNDYLQRGVNNAGRQVNVPAITITGGIVNLEKGSVLRNHVASWDVSGIKMSGGTLNINGGSLFNNYGGNHGGAIFADSTNCIINMTSGTIRGNQARQSTGAICADHGAQLMISGGEISNNYTSGRAGAIYINGTLVVSDSAYIHDNRADANGGAIVQTDGTMSIRGGIIEDNSAGGNGGGIASLRGIFNLEGGKIQNNKASLGSGVYLDSGATIAGELALDGISDDIYTSRVYTMALNGNGVDNPKNQTIRFLGKYELPVLERNGYEFLGWYTAKEGGEPVQTGDWIKATKNMTLHAQWKLTATDEIQLTKQLEGGVFYIEDNEELSVAATTKNNAAVSYQWYRCDDENGTNKVALERETSATLTLPKDLGTYYYFCVISAKDAVDVVSEIVKVEMISKDVAYTPVFVKQPTNAEVYVGETVRFEAQATTVDQGTITYQWYRSIDNTTNVDTAEKIYDATSAIYEVQATEAGTYHYFVVATNTIKNQKEEVVMATTVSNLAQLIVHGKIQVTDLTANDSVMDKEYWNTYRIGTTQSKDGYITEVKSARGSWGNNSLDRAFDGNWSTFWETNSSGNNNAVEVTFDKPVTLDRIVYATRQDSQKGKGYPTRLAVYSKDENGDYKEVGVAESAETGGYRMFTLPETVTTTGLKFAFTQGTWNNWASAAELVFLRAESSVLTGCATIYGTAIPGSKLSVRTELTVGSKENLAYQWQESNDGVSYTDIQGETSDSYTVKTDDANKYLRVVVSDTSNQFTNTIVSEPYGGLVDVTLEGTPAVGESLKSVMNYVDGDAKYEYQWQRSSNGTAFTNIENAIEETYLVDNSVANQYLRLAVKVSVEGTNAITVYSDAVHVDATAIMTGAPQVGSTLKASVRGIERKENSATYTWEISDSETGEFKAVSDVTGTTYTIKESDLDKFIRVKAELTESKETIVSEAWQIKEAGTYDDLEGEFVYLSDIRKEKLISSSIGYKTLMYDANTSGGRITLLVNGEKNYFLKGLGAHAPSTLVYDLSDYVKYYQFDRFIAYLGLDNGQGDQGNGVKFTIQTSTDNTTWTTVKTTDVLKGNTDAVKVDIPLENAKYLKIDISDNGSKAHDHSVVADAKLATLSYNEESEAQDLIKTVEEYDKELKAFEETYPEKSAKELLEMNDYKQLLYQRTFVSDAGYPLLKSYLAGDNYVKTLEWFMNDMEALDLYVGGGKAAGSYTNFMDILTRLYIQHGDDFKEEHGSLYKKMMITIALTHSTTVSYWADGSVKSDPLNRYEIFKHMYDNGVLLNNVFENLTVEEMRWVMNSIAGDDELEWANYYLRYHTKIKNIPESQLNVSNFTPGPYYFIKYTFGYNYNQEKYYSQENKEDWQKKYSLTDETADPKDNRFHLDVTYQSGHPKMWIVWEEGAVCGGISKTGNSLLTSFGVPGGVVTQPGHAAYLQYSYTNPNAGSDGVGIWNIQNDIFGWPKSVRYQRMLNGWGSESWTSYYQGSYILLGQAAINDEANYFKANRLVRLADVYADNVEKQIELYEEALTVQNINMDAWVGLVDAYKKAGKSEAEFVQLAKRISKALAYYPLPMYDILQNLIKPQIQSTVALADLKIYQQTALKTAAKATANDTTQPSAAKQMANYLLGENKFEIATFSFDGENAGKIMLNEAYSAGNELLYSLDGGKEWKSAGVTTEVSLTKSELESITVENDILVRLQGTTSYYTIDITKSSIPSNLYRNDRENRLIGKIANLEWALEGEDQWTDLTADTTFTGDQKIKVRVKANGTVQASDIATYLFTTDTDTASKKYIPLSHVSYVGTSSEQVNQGGSATNALTGEPNSMWHTLWAGGDNERYITVKFDEPRYLTAVDYTPRQSGNNGRFLDAEVYVSMDGEDWMLAGSVTGWADNASTKRINLFGPTYTKYVKIVGTRTVANFGSAAMLEFFEDTTVESKNVVSIELKTAPKKRNYLLGEQINLKGLVVIANYDDGTRSTIKHKFLQCDKTILDKLGKETISVSYIRNGEVMPITFDVNVEENTKDISGITVTELPINKRYFVGDSLDTTGMVVKAQYVDGTEGYIFDGMYQVVPETFAKATDSQEITIQYTRNGKTVSDTFAGIEVTKTVKSITISKKPTKTTYSLGDDFNDKGMQVSVVYDDNTKEVLDSTDYVIESDGFSNNPGTKNVTVTYARKPEIKTSVSVIVFPYIQTDQFIFEAAEGKDTASLTYAIGEAVPESGRLEIPSTITVAETLEFTVTAIGRSSFEDQTNVQSVVIPNTVQSIEKDAFKNSTGLKEVYLTEYDNFDHLSIADTAFTGVTGGTIYVANERLVQELKAKNIRGIANFAIKSIADKVTALEIQTPNKQDYALGEAVDFTGLEIYGVLEDENKVLLTSETYTMSAFDKNKAGEQVITVTLNGKSITASFVLKVTPATPNIKTQPLDMAYNTTEQPEALKVVASTNDKGHLNYQWYSNTTNSYDGATLIKGAISDSYVPELNDQYYFVVVTNNDAVNTDGTGVSVTSDIAHIQVGSYEARIGNTSYATLKEAVAGAKNGATIQLRKDITVGETIVLNKNLTISGHTVKRADTFKGAIFQVEKGTVVFENVTVDGGAVWTGTENTVLKRGTSNTGIVADNALVLVTSGELNLGEGAVLKNNANNSNNYGRSGGAVRITSGTLRMTGGTIKDNYAAPYGGAVLAINSSVIMESGLVSGNHGTSSGGTFCIDQSANFTMTNTKNPEDAIIENNLGDGNGGAIWLSNGKATLNGGTIRNNKASNGGAIYMQGNGTLEMGDVTMTGNKVWNMVDGIYYANGTIKITGVPQMKDDIYITGQKQLHITSDLTNIQSQIRISNPGGNAAFAVADTEEHAKAAEHAFVLGNKTLSVYVDGTNLCYKKKE